MMGIIDGLKRRWSYLRLLIKKNLVLQQMLAVLVLFVAIFIADVLLHPSMALDDLLFGSLVIAAGLGLGFLIGDILYHIPLRIKRPDT